MTEQQQEFPVEPGQPTEPEQPDPTPAPEPATEPTHPGADGEEEQEEE